MAPEDDLRPLLGGLEGDVARAEQLFRACERFLRRAVRRWLSPQRRRRFDSADVVQSVWAGLLRRGTDGRRFPTPEHLRAFLIRAARSRLIDRARRHRAAIALELPAPPSHLAWQTPAGTPRPSEEIRAGDLWERLLARCPPEHRPVLTLRR